MSYEPEVNDYVTWKKDVEGWIYFKDREYVTIEMSVTPRHHEDVGHTPFHRNDRLLVLCYSEQWNELKYVKSRTSIHGQEENRMEIVGESIR